LVDFVPGTNASRAGTKQLRRKKTSHVHRHQGKPPQKTLELDNGYEVHGIRTKWTTYKSPVGRTEREYRSQPPNGREENRELGEAQIGGGKKQRRGQKTGSRKGELSR